MKHVVIIGGGFAGINLLQSLSMSPHFHVTLVDRNNYNFFPPLLYQVATGFLEPSAISYPFRRLTRNRRTSFRMGELLRVIPECQKVILSSGELTYDYLVLATGAESNFFGNENVQNHSLPMKTVNDAIQLRNHLLQQLERATVTTDPVEQAACLTVVIAGAGPTGVEVAGMLAEMRRNILLKDYPELAKDQNAAQIYLVDGGKSVLGPMSLRSQADTLLALEKLGVKVKLNIQVKDYLDQTVIFSDGEFINTKTLIWAAGVSASILQGINPSSYGRGKRLLVNEFNRVIDYTSVYAIGDNCLQQTDKKFPNGHPQLAQVGIQQGKRLAFNLIALESEQALTAFEYHDKGAMAIIGWNKAVVDIPKPVLHFNGTLAWLMWIFVHLFSLSHFRNKFQTFLSWMASYLTRDQSLRMIFRPDKS
jgi:NADH:ubiquinone reductase (H+-translocating)